MRLVCMSDLHRRYGIAVPEGDVLIIAGDILAYGLFSELHDFKEFMDGLPHKHKILVAGNHDWPFQVFHDDSVELLGESVTYLQDSGCTIDGVTFWGSPWQPRFYNWAFNLDRGQPLRDKWALIPDDTDVLITHGPPFGILDTVESGMRVGCEDLANALKRFKPKVHVFGHIHSSYGMVERDDCIFVNASICNEQYLATKEPIIVDL